MIIAVRLSSLPSIFSDPVFSIVGICSWKGECENWLVVVNRSPEVVELGSEVVEIILVAVVLEWVVALCVIFSLVPLDCLHCIIQNAWLHTLLLLNGYFIDLLWLV